MILLETDNAMHPDKLFNIVHDIGCRLYIKGELFQSDMKSVAIVGTRKPSLYGVKMAKILTENAVNDGYTVISGLARGIDTEVHRTAVQKGGRTIAVMGTGIDNIYPEENIALAEEIANHGAVISQFPPETPPLRKNFPMRNRVVAALAKKLILVEAPLKSGALITSRLALEMGKEVYVLPGRFDESGFMGNLAFLNRNRENSCVKMITNLGDIFKELPVQTTTRDLLSKKRKIPGNLSENEKKIINILQSSEDGLFFDIIAERCEMDAKELPSELLTLVLKNIVVEKKGNIYKLKEDYL